MRGKLMPPGFQAGLGAGESECGLQCRTGMGWTERNGRLADPGDQPDSNFTEIFLDRKITALLSYLSTSPSIAIIVYPKISGYFPMLYQSFRRLHIAAGAIFSPAPE
jgi:hypothetical protein